MDIIMPREYTFFIEDAIRDCEKPNRLWFKYPQDWKTSMNRQPVLALRRLTFHRCYRKIKYEYTIKRYNKSVSLIEPDEEVSVNIVSYLDYTKDLRELFIDSKKQFNDELVNCKLQDVFHDMLRMDFAYKYVEDNSRKSYVEIFKCEKGDGEYKYTISITNMNDDFKNVLNYFGPDIIDSEEDILFWDVWDRHSSFLKSSLSFNNARNHLGQSDTTYPIFKYFKLDTETDRFWIEFYNSRDNEVPNIYPEDDKEGIILEVQLITNN